MLKAGGIWVSPIEIENVLIDHEAVQECAVIGRDDGHGLTKPFAYVVLRAGVGKLRSWPPRCSSSFASGWPTTSARAGGVRGGTAEDRDRQAAALQASRCTDSVARLVREAAWAPRALP